MRGSTGAWALLLAGCAAPYGGLTGELGDTGWFETDAPVVGCDGAVESVVPADGAVDWTWTDLPKVFVSHATVDGEPWPVRLVDGLGVEIPSDVVPDATGLVLSVVPRAGHLLANAEHRLQVTGCDGPQETVFTTSTLGLPLADGPASVRGRTYVLDLDDAEWLEPAGFSGVLASVVKPILLGVRLVDAERLDWIGAVGVTELGVVEQDEDAPTWGFPMASFAEAPFVVAEADRVDIPLPGDAVLRIDDFTVRGTFTSDGSLLAQSTVTGIGDTRDTGGAVGQGGNPAAICDLASALGVDCVACKDGEPYCLRVSLRALDAPVVPGLVLRPILTE